MRIIRRRSEGRGSRLWKTTRKMWNRKLMERNVSASPFLLLPSLFQFEYGNWVPVEEEEEEEEEVEAEDEEEDQVEGWSTPTKSK
ncbi:hypothetical protein RUM43_010027 [Polyplax serrata]|uniref:Uncharacterized protein n=1 Tax=Polyplax serrata TaxID=468196 RepID=A0AAN8Q479_POLSC